MTVVNLRRPVVVDGQVRGVLASTITVADAVRVHHRPRDRARPERVRAVRARPRAGAQHAGAGFPRPRAGAAAAAGRPRSATRCCSGSGARAGRTAGSRSASGPPAAARRRPSTSTSTRPGAAARPALAGRQLFRERGGRQPARPRCCRPPWLGVVGLLAAAGRGVLARPPGQPPDRAAGRGGERDPDPRPRRRRAAAALASARDRPGRDRVQRHGRRAARVRALRAAQICPEPDQPRRSRPRWRPRTAR